MSFGSFGKILNFHETENGIVQEVFNNGYIIQIKGKSSSPSKKKSICDLYKIKICGRNINNNYIDIITEHNFFKIETDFWSDWMDLKDFNTVMVDIQLVS